MSRAQQGAQVIPTPPTPPAPPVIVGGGDGGPYIITAPRSVQDLEAMRERRSELSNQLISAADRRAGIENAVDAIAVEIERISEGQRFVTKLLTEQSPNASLPQRQSQGARIGSRSDP